MTFCKLELREIDEGSAREPRKATTTLDRFSELFTQKIIRHFMLKT